MTQDFGSHIVISTPRNSVLIQRSGNYDHAFGLPNALSAENDSIGHVRWGAADNMPNTMKKLIATNHLVPSLLTAIRDLTYAQGLGFFKREIVDNKLQLIPYLDNKLEDWSYETELDEYLSTGLNQYVEMGNCFARMTYDPIKDWFKLGVSDAFATRIKQPVNGKVEKYVVNPYFGDYLWYDNQKSNDEIAAFDFSNPLKNKKNIVSILHCKDNIPGNPFYSYPSWWCAKEWIEVSNLIPVFHKNGIKNGYNIKYLIKMPKDYFDKEGNKMLDEKAIVRKWAEFSNNLSNWLAGEKNVNKTLLVKFLRAGDGKAQDNVDVVPIKNEMADDAYSKVWEMTDKSISNAIGLTPTLGGVSPGNGNDSGSQVRVMADYQSNFRTQVVRDKLLKPVLYSLREMGYKDIVPTFKGIQITTLDANPTGKQAVLNHG